MPASRSPSRKPERRDLGSRAPGQPATLRGAKYRLAWPIALFSLLVIVVLVAIALPAELITRFLPPPIKAGDFSGSIWHGSAGRISIDSRTVGALEWRLHPLSLLSMTLLADLHWVKGATVVDGNVRLDAHGFVARDVRGGGPIEDLRDLGLNSGWHGTGKLDLVEIKGSFEAVASATGTIDVAALSFAGIAAGADLGGYRATLGADAVNAGVISAAINDTGGPIEAHAEFHYSAASHTGSLSGTLLERPEASQALRMELANLTQLRPRDGAGRIPVELEFRL